MSTPNPAAFRLERMGRDWHLTEGRSSGTYFGTDVTLFSRWADAVDYLDRRGYDTTGIVAPTSQAVGS